MSIGSKMAHRLKDWFKSRPEWKVEECTLWFLMVFAFVHGGTGDGVEIEWYFCIVPVISVPILSWASAIFCLTVSLVIFFEPILPSRVWAWTKEARYSLSWHIVRGIVVLSAFTLGLVNGIVLIAKTRDISPHLVISLVLVGFAIMLAMVVKNVYLAAKGHPG